MVLPLRFSSYSTSTRAGRSTCAAAAPLSARLASHHQLRIVSFHMHDTIAERQAPVEEPAHRARIDHVLLLEDARGEARRIVAVEHRHGGLDHDRAVIELGGDEMNRAAVHLYARREG